MNPMLAIGILLLSAIVLAIVIELGRARATKRRQRRAMKAPPKRMPHLEQRMAAAFEGPRRSYGPCFAEFSIWRQYETTRMDVGTTGTWRALNDFTRALAVRHLWRALVKLTGGTVVVHVDPGTPTAILWTQASTDEFKDFGMTEPWAPAKGRVGTLISGS